MERLETDDMNNSGLEKENALKKLVLGRLEGLEIRPNENLGQH